MAAPVLGTYGGTISNNTFSNHAANGIQAGIQHVLVSGNTFSNNASSGMALTSFGNAGADRGAQNSTLPGTALPEMRPQRATQPSSSAQPRRQGLSRPTSRTRIISPSIPSALSMAAARRSTLRTTTGVLPRDQPTRATRAGPVTAWLPPGLELLPLFLS